MKYFGAHVSTQGGLKNAPLNAKAIGADCFALFTKNQRQWRAPALTREEIDAFTESCRDNGYSCKQILPHDSYLINLGQPDNEKRQNALQAFILELERCRQLGLDRLNFHPGSSLHLIPDDECIKLIAESVRIAVDTVPGVCAVFENTAGQGSNLGYTFSQLSQMLEATDRPDRVGVCIDTCHAFAAGYDLTGDEAYEITMAEFDRLIGFKYLKGMHLNDAKCALGGKLDRHASIGEGSLGWETFRRIVEDPRIDNIPMVLETPDPDKWSKEIAGLRSFTKA